MVSLKQSNLEGFIGAPQVFFSWKVDFLSLFKKRPNINLYLEYSWTYCQFFKDSKFAYKTTKFYTKWPVRNFGQKH